MRGLLTHARFTSDSGQGVTNTYDGFGRLRVSSSNLGGVTRDVTTDYEPGINLKRLTHPDGQYFEYAYDDADKLFHLSENGPSITLASIFYDGEGLRDELARDAAGAVTQYDYDPISRLEVLTHDLDGMGAGNDAGFGFDYNPASQITLRVLTNAAYEFPFSASVKSYVTNGRNQYTQVGGTNHSWDANGNLTSDGPTGTSYGYDTENRLVSASGANTGTLQYDPLGRLWEASTSSGVVRFVYDGDRLIAEYSTGGAVLRRYVHGAGIDEPLVWYEGSAVSSAARRYLHADHQGSIVATSNASGVKQQIHTYDAYGVTAAGNTGRFQYTGQAAIPELGLLYYKARFYNPGLGRFMQTDPIGYDDDVNLYAYVYNDPINATDPQGTCGTLITGAVSASCRSIGGVASESAEEGGAPSNDASAQGADVNTPQSEFGAHEAAELIWPGYDLGTCMSSRGDCGAGDWILGVIGVIPGGKGAALGIKGLLGGLRMGTSASVRMVESSAELGKVFNELSAGAKRMEGTNYPGQLLEHADGTRVGLRSTSRSGGATIDVHYPDGTGSKVHIQGGGP